MDEYAESKHVLVADVDCTAGGKDLCEKHGIGGYPTIKYGDPDDLQDYAGERSLEDLQAFAKENLKPLQKKTALEIATRSAMKALRPLQDDVNHILQLRKNAAVVLLSVGGFIGMFIGILLTRCFCPRRVNVSSEKKEK